KMTPNKYHCSSSQAFELMSNALRLTAFVALMTTTTRITQLTVRPTRRLNASIERDKASRLRMCSPLIAHNSTEQRALWARCVFGVKHFNHCEPVSRVLLSSPARPAAHT